MVEKQPLKFADVNRDRIEGKGFCGQSTFFIKETEVKVHGVKGLGFRV